MITKRALLATISLTSAAMAMEQETFSLTSAAMATEAQNLIEEIPAICSKTNTSTVRWSPELSSDNMPFPTSALVTPFTEMLDFRKNRDTNAILTTEQMPTLTFNSSAYSAHMKASAHIQAITAAELQQTAHSYTGPIIPFDVKLLHEPKNASYSFAGIFDILKERSNRAFYLVPMAMFVLAHINAHNK